jgi:cyclophilin family peptidyl-prolyl cis-trans isomerase
MKRILFSVAIVVLAQMLVFCQKQTYVEIETTYGNIEIQLYDETPEHRDNFLKLVEEGYYDGTLFHRVISEFMIQGGDPNSKGASPEARLGDGGPGYQLDAEILYPKYFHKRGALSAARQGDQVNPEKKSSGSQFYLVQGKVFTNEELNQMEQMRSERQRQQILMKFATPYRNELTGFQQANDRAGFEALMEQIEQEAASEMDAVEAFVIPENHRIVYTSEGGVPHLDGDYTVFGQVVKGLEVIDSIAALEVNNMDRPLEDVVVNMRVVKK